MTYKYDKFSIIKYIQYKNDDRILDKISNSLNKK